MEHKAIKEIMKTIVYIVNPYKHTGTPSKLEHPPIGQAFVMTSPYERYPENIMPAIAMIRMILNAIIFFIIRNKSI